MNSAKVFKKVSEVLWSASLGLIAAGAFCAVFNDPVSAGTCFVWAILTMAALLLVVVTEAILL